MDVLYAGLAVLLLTWGLARGCAALLAAGVKS